MTVLLSYTELALNCSQIKKSNLHFSLYIFSSILLSILTGYFLSSIQIGKAPRTIVNNVPERIAQFLSENPRKKSVHIKSKPKVKTKLKYRVKKKKQNKVVVNKKLTKAVKQARKNAKKSGLLALNKELADLIDTKGISSVLSEKTSTGKGTKTDFNSNILSQGISSVSIINIQSETQINTNTKLSSQDVSDFKKSLLVSSVNPENTSHHSDTDSKRANVRLEEQVTVTFDKNKNKLYSIYNRARRKNPGLKGKLILEITIAPSGLVTKVKMLLNELKDKNLENRVIARVYQFHFDNNGNQNITVTFPIEFIPS